MTIHGLERKDNHGSTSVSFTPKLEQSGSDKIFLTFNRPSGSKFVPVYKSEVKGSSKGSYDWNQVISDSHSLADDEEDNIVMI